MGDFLGGCCRGVFSPENTVFISIAKEGEERENDLIYCCFSRMHSHAGAMGTRNHIEDALLINEEETAFIPIFFEAFAPSFHTPAFIKEYKDFFDEIALFYEHNFKALVTKNEINPTLNPSALSRAFVSMLDGIVLHKGFFQIENKQYEAMVKESIAFFKRGLL